MIYGKPHSKQARRLIVLGLLVPCLLISVPAIVAYRAQRELADSFHWISHTLEVQRQLQHLVSLLTGAESGQRGFLLSSRDSYLEPYKSGLDELPREIAKLRTLTADNPVQQEHLRQLDRLVAAKLNFMAQTISLQQRGNREAALALVSTERGKQTMDAVRARLELMEQEESRLLVARQQFLVSRARFSTGFLLALVALNFLFAGAIFVMLLRLSNARSLVSICAWSRTVEYQGEWLSFEEYLLRRFNLNTSHSISPAQAEKAFGSSQHKTNAA